MAGYQVILTLDLAGGCALALGVVLFAVAISRALVFDPDLVVPAIDQGEQEKAHPVGPGDFLPDLAWPSYPFRQSRADLERIQANLAGLNSAVWRWPSRTFLQNPGWWVVFPLPVAIICFLSLASLVSWFCYLVYALTHGVIVGASLMLLVPAAAALRARERWRRSRLLTQGACMQCFHVTQWPAYQCPGCQRRHHDVRPGRLGLLVRRCVCGTYLVTMASRTAWQVTPLCQRCGAELPPGAGGVRDIRVPVFGDISAGKTRFLYASLSSLMQTARRAGMEVSFPDEGSGKLAEFGLGVIASGRETAKTSTSAQVTLTCRLGTGRRSELVHLFDAAGEHFRAARHPDALRFLDDGQGLVYVLDPFSIAVVRKRLDGRDSTALQLAHAAAGDPELTYDEVVSRLRDSGVPASAQRLAVVISKADLLRSAGLDLPDGSGEIAGWLRECGVHNLVMSARHEFAAVRFFTVASQDKTPGDRDDPGAPLRWLLTSHGSRLPAEQADVAGHAGSTGQPAESGRPGRGQSKPAEARS